MPKSKAKQRKKTQRQNHQRQKRKALPPGVLRVDGPAKRLPEMFAVLDEVTITADRAAMEPGGASSHLERFDLAISMRATNLLKASRSLLENGHWEVAASAARQVFELLVNAEYIAAQPDRNEVCIKYATYGLIQQAESNLRTLGYDRNTGRPVDEQREAHLRAFLASEDLAGFRARNGKWKPQWSGLNTRGLAEKSPEPLRAEQYEQLFVAWSEQTHAAPVTLLHAIFPSGKVDGWAEDQIAADDREVGQMILMLVTLYVELLQALPNASFVSAETQFKWIDKLGQAAKAGDQASE